VLDFFVLRLDERLGEALLSTTLTLAAILLAAALTGSGIQVVGFHELENATPVYLAAALTLIGFGLAVGLQWLALRATGADVTLSIEVIDPAAGPRVLSGAYRGALRGIGLAGTGRAAGPASGEATGRVVAAAVAALGPNTFGLVLLIGNLVGALAEEALFRGLLQGALENEYGRSAAVLLQALLFGLWHLVWPAKAFLAGQATLRQAAASGAALVAVSAIVGIAFGAMRVVSGSLWVPVVVHFLSNTIYNLLHLRTGRGLVRDLGLMQAIATLGLLAVAPVLQRMLQ